MNPLRQLEQRYYRPRRRPRSFGEAVHPVRFRVDPLPSPVHHESQATSWAAAVAILVSWKRGDSANVGAVLSSLDGPFRGILDEGRGLAEDEATDLMVVSGIARRGLERPRNPASWHELLRQYGPVWALWPEGRRERASWRGVLVVGIAGDGTPSGTRLLLHDALRGRRRRVTVKQLVQRLQNEEGTVDVLHLPQRARQDLQAPATESETAAAPEPSTTPAARAESLSWVRAFDQPTLSAAGLDFIARHEGFRGELYNDAGGHCTIGYGHLVHMGPCNGSEPEEFRRGISQARARELLRADAAGAERTVRQAVTPTLTQTELDALVSFVFNIGNQAFLDSTLLRELNAGRRDRVPEQLRQWNRSGGRVVEGLRRRREDEVRLFAHGDYGGAARGQSWVAAASIPPAVVGSTETVLDRDARLRNGPPDFATVGGRIAQYSQVRIDAVSSDGRYVQVSNAAGSRLGWTARSNLGAFYKDDPTLAGIALAPSRPIAIDSSWPLQKRRLAEVYNRLGGLFQAIATSTGTRIAAALAVWSIESGGRSHTPSRGIIRFENHLLFRQWGESNVAQYDAHFQHGGHAGVGGRAWQNHRYRRTASGSWTTFHGNQTSEYDVLDLATSLAGETIALQCISIGGPQILVRNYRTLGYGSPRAMYDAFQADERWQVLGFYDYCQYHGGHLARRRYLLDHLRAERWVDFARGYNGSGQAEQYGSRIRAAYELASQLPLP